MSIKFFFFKIFVVILYQKLEFSLIGRMIWWDGTKIYSLTSIFLFFFCGKLKFENWIIRSIHTFWNFLQLTHLCAKSMWSRSREHFIIYFLFDNGILQILKNIGMPIKNVSIQRKDVKTKKKIHSRYFRDLRSILKKKKYSKGNKTTEFH